MTMSRTLLVVAIALSACSSLAAPLPVPPRPVLAIELTCSTPTISPGQEGAFVAHLINKGGKPITVLLPGDGSESRRRTPMVRWSPAMNTAGCCSIMSPLKPADVIELASGQRVKLGWIGWPTFTEVGLHKVSLELEHVPTMEFRYGGDRGALKKARETAPFKITSNVVEVRIRAKS
jgi:hypothetical protein